MENTTSNILHLSGEIGSPIEYSHESHNTKFYTFKLRSRRLSGTFDIINAIIREELLAEYDLKEGLFITTVCELRSFNRKTENGNKLIITAYIKELSISEIEFHENELTLTGTICKSPVLRETPLGREICDIMLATNRKYGRSDYLPLIIWGRNARRAYQFDTGDKITVCGRIQSREYIKITDGSETLKTTYEVSVSSIEEYSEE